MTRDEIATNVRENLEDAGITFYSATDISDSIQDGYDDVAVITGCIQKSVTLNFTANLSYYDFKTLIADYYAPVALYNNVTKRWMDPDGKRIFRKVRRDYELWSGEPGFWAVIDARKVGIFPRKTATSGTFTVFYRATANTLSGSDTPLIHADVVDLLENYATGDLLDQAQEYIKADKYLGNYFTDVLKYKTRIGSLAKTDYLPVLTINH